MHLILFLTPTIPLLISREIIPIFEIVWEIPSNPRSYFSARRPCPHQSPSFCPGNPWLTRGTMLGLGRCDECEFRMRTRPTIRRFNPVSGAVVVGGDHCRRWRPLLDVRRPCKAGTHDLTNDGRTQMWCILLACWITTDRPSHAQCCTHFLRTHHSTSGALDFAPSGPGRSGPLALIDAFMYAKCEFRVEFSCPLKGPNQVQQCT